MTNDLAQKHLGYRTSIRRAVRRAWHNAFGHGQDEIVELVSMHKAVGRCVGCWTITYIHEGGYTTLDELADRIWGEDGP